MATAGSRRGRRLHEVSVELEVPFHDIDLVRVVWHGHYYKYLELARTEFMRARKLDVPDLIALGFGLLIIESGCRYVSPLRYGDRIRVSAWLKDFRYRIHVAYEIVNLTSGRRAARGHTKLVATTPRGEMFHQTPEAILERLVGDAADPGEPSS
ncbi:MAG: acyl-CoA thioesterase [Myxococcota bacterium]